MYNVQCIYNFQMLHSSLHRYESDAHASDAQGSNAHASNTKSANKIDKKDNTRIVIQLNLFKNFLQRI